MALYLSTIPFYEDGNAGDLEKREILSQLLDIRDEQGSIIDILQYTDRYKPTDNKEFFSFTNDWLYNTATIAEASGTVSAGGTTTLSLASAANVRAGEVLLTKDGKIAYVRSKSNNDIVIQAVDAITWASGEVVSFPTNAIAEGQAGSEMPISQLQKRSNQLQHFETFTSASDLGLGSRIEVTIGGQDYYFYKQQHDAYLKHRADIGYAFVVGKKSSGTDANGNTVYLTRGIDNYIVDYGGITQTATNTATNSFRIDKADFRTFNRSLDQNKAPMEGFFWTGGEMGASIDDLFDSELAAGGVVYSAFGIGNPKAKAVDLGVKTFNVYGRTFHKSNLPALDHVKVTAAADYIYPDLGYFIPADKIKVEGGGMADRIAGRYLNLPLGLNGRYHEILTGGLAPVPTKREAVLEVTYKSWEGLEIVGTEHFGRLRLAAS